MAWVDVGIAAVELAPEVVGGAEAATAGAGALSLIHI